MSISAKKSMTTHTIEKEGPGLGKSTLARRPQNAPRPPSPVGEAHLVMWEDTQVR